MAAISVAAFIANVVPQGIDRTIVKASVGLDRRRRRDRRTLIARRMREHLGEELVAEFDVERSIDLFAEKRAEAKIGLIRGMTIRGWRIRTRLIGEDHITNALAQRNGIVFWAASTHRFSPTAFALCDAGVRTRVVSRKHHLMPTGDRVFDRTVGARVAPWVRWGETRFSDRYELEDVPRETVIIDLESMLLANGSILLEGEMGKNASSRPVHIHRTLSSIAPGAPRFALATGAALLPIYNKRVGPENYEIIVGPPLHARDGLTGREAWDDLAQQFADFIAGYIEDEPSNWPGWTRETLG